MSKWKQQIDFELGNDRKFNQALEQTILQKTLKQKNFTYPITLIGACMIALILFFTWPEKTPQPHQANGVALSLNNFANTESVSAFYVSHLTPEDAQFLARANTLAFGVEKFNSKNDIHVIMSMLQNARLATQTWTSYDYDVILKFDSGKEKKIKISTIHEAVGILDLETGLYYEADGDYAEFFWQSINNKTYPLLLFTILNLITYLLICVNVKDKAPSSVKIFLRFILITLVIFIVQQKNIILSIWLPVAILIGLALHRLFKLQQEDYDKVKLRKIKIYTILLIAMWSIVFISQLVGGIL